MGLAKITIRMLSDVLVGKFGLILYREEAEEATETLRVRGEARYLESRPDALCKQIGLDPDTRLWGLYLGIEPDTIDFCVGTSEEICDRVYGMLKAGKLDGDVGNYKPRGGGQDADREV